MAIQRAALLERIGLALARLGIEPPPLPVPFYDGYLGLVGARAVLAATRLGVFRALSGGPVETKTLARRLELEPERLEVLLTALASLGYVRRRRGERWGATRRARRWLGSDGLDAVVGELAYHVWDRMAGLEDVLAGGTPTGWHEAGPDDRLWGGYQRAMAQMERITAPAVASAIPARAPRRLLDLGGGPGLHAAQMCRSHPGLEATVVDLEGATRQSSPQERVRFVAGDFFEGDLGSGYDVVTAHAVLHNFDREACVTLLGRAREALAPGGLLAVQDLERAPVGRAGTQIASLGGLVFMTAMGARTYTAAELAAMAAEAGFTEIEIRRPVRLAGSVVMLARRPAAW